MAKARTRQTDNKVSMESVTSLSGRRQEMAKRKRAYLAGDEHNKGSLAALRETLRTANKSKAVATLKKIAKEHGPMEYNRALKLINPTFLGMDVIPEKIADIKKLKPVQKRW